MNLKSMDCINREYSMSMVIKKSWPLNIQLLACSDSDTALK